MFSYHGLPQALVDRGDPYYQQCVETTELICKALDLTNDDWELSFQSRLGRAQWLQPYTEQTIKALGKNGVKTLDIICPGFSADCLETLEEINIQNRHFFLEAGGETFNYIPALNDQPGHIEAIKQIIL